MSTSVSWGELRKTHLRILQALPGEQGGQVPHTYNVGYVLGLKSSVDKQAEAVVLSLARSIEARDPLTRGHSERLAEYAVMLGEKIGLYAGELTALRVGSLVHDIGKIVVPDSILFKPGSLTSSERAIIERHPIVGEEICAPIESLRETLPIIRHHHERMDGTGYPDGLKGERIPLGARIIQIVDIYDALTSNRPYRKALSPQAALEQLFNEAEFGWLDTSLVLEFEQLVHASLPSLSRDRTMLVDYYQ